MLSIAFHGGRDWQEVLCAGFCIGKDYHTLHPILCHFQILVTEKTLSLQELLTLAEENTDALKEIVTV